MDRPSRNEAEGSGEEKEEEEGEDEEEEEEEKRLHGHCSDLGGEQQYRSLLEYRTLVGYIAADISGLLLAEE